jgi:hypothetical protein
MAAFLIIVRIALFLAIVVPLVVWVVRRARVAHDIPTDRDVDHHTNQARAEWSARGPSDYGGGY